MSLFPRISHFGGDGITQRRARLCVNTHTPDSTLSANMARRIREHRGSQAERLLKIGVRSELVFSNTEGEPILRRNLARRHFKPALKTAKLPTNLSLYCLRHTCASLLLQAGIHPKVVAERLGHSSTKLTLDIYSHIAPGMQCEAANGLDQLLYG
jgi:integrase